MDLPAALRPGQPRPVGDARAARPARSGCSRPRQWRKAGFIAALLDYDDFVVTYETGVDEQLRFDAHIEVYGEQASMRIQYDTPYVRHLPTTLVTERTVGDAYERSVSRPHLKDPYTARAGVLPRHGRDRGRYPKTSPEDYVEDMELFIELIRAMAERHRHDPRLDPKISRVQDRARRSPISLDDRRAAERTQPC